MPDNSIIGGPNDPVASAVLAADQSFRNAGTFYQSEEGQGKMTAYLGVGLIGVAYFAKSWVLAIVGIVVAAAGWTRMQRASATLNSATLTYAATLSPGIPKI